MTAWRLLINPQKKLKILKNTSVKFSTTQPYAHNRIYLRPASYKPYMKPGNTPQYVHRNSNHPPSILRSVPEAINKRLSNISSDKKAFDSTVPPYQEALQKSGYNFKLQYNSQPSKPKRSRSRNVIWFNPLYNPQLVRILAISFLKPSMIVSHPIILYAKYSTETL